MGQEPISKTGKITQLLDSPKNLEAQNMSRTIISTMANKIIEMIAHAPLASDLKILYNKKLSLLSADEALIQIFLSSDCKVTPTDIKYILCFYIDMIVRDISLTLSVEVASVYTVRYRIRKKFKDNIAFQFLM